MCFTFGPDMEEKLSTIIEQSSLLFMKYGIRSLTMDDVAKNLRMSKKTLYQFVSDKDDLVNKCIEASCTNDKNCIEHIVQEGQNAIDEIMAISRFVSSRLNNIHPSIFFDLEKYHPAAMSRFEKHRDEYIYSSIKRNIEVGMSEGLYRPDINPSIIARIYLSCVDQVLHGPMTQITDYSIAEAYKELINYHLHGLASEKGLIYLSTLQNQPK